VEIHSYSRLSSFIRVKPSIKGISVTFTNVISASMMNRLMLNIRDKQRVEINTNYNGIATLHFADDELMEGRQVIAEEPEEGLEEIELSEISTAQNASARV